MVAEGGGEWYDQRMAVQDNLVLWCDKDGVYRLLLKSL